MAELRDTYGELRARELRKDPGARGDGDGEDGMVERAGHEFDDEWGERYSARSVTLSVFIGVCS